MQKDIANLRRKLYPCRYTTNCKGESKEMLTMSKVNDIRKSYFNQGQNISEISKIHSIDRKTVKKYIDQEDFNTLQKPPAKHESKIDKYKEVIDKWLVDDLNFRAKQRHTAKRVYDRLCKEYKDFNASYRTIALYVASRKKEIYNDNKSYLPLRHIAGEAQVDFGKAEFFENGHKIYGTYLNVSFPYSNSGFIQLFKGENRECLLQGLKNIFEFLGGVPHRMWFDNLSAAVHMKGKERIINQEFLRFCNHYGFEYVFCNPGKGNEKGNVESKVGYHRRNMLVPAPDFKDIHEYNRILLQNCVDDMNRPHYKKETSIKELFEEDIKCSIPLPETPYDVLKIETFKTDNYGKFTVDSKYCYSVSPRYANCTVTVKFTADKVYVLDEQYRVIVTHNRLYGDNKKESMNWLLYLSTIAKKPKALKYTGVYDLFPNPLKRYIDTLDNGSLKQLLGGMSKLCESDDFDNVLKTVESAIAYNTKDKDSLIALHRRLNSPLLPEPIGISSNVPKLKIVPPPSLACYDNKFLGGM